MLQHTEADQGYPARIYRRSERAKVIYTTMLSLRSSRNKITKMVTGWALCDTIFDTRFITKRPEAHLTDDAPGVCITY